MEKYAFIIIRLLSVNLWCKSTLDMKCILIVKVIVIVQMDIVIYLYLLPALWIGLTRMASDCDKVFILSA